MPKFKKILPLLVILIVIALLFYFDGYSYFNFDSLKTHYQYLQQLVAQHYIRVLLIYLGLYILIVGTSSPFAVWMTLAGGLLFGLWLGTLFAVIGATLGAAVIFLALRTAFGDYLTRRASGWVAKLEHGLEHHSVRYVMVLHLIPVVPFFVANIIAGLIAMRLRDFMLATCLGILPGTFIYAWVGRDLEGIMTSGQVPNLRLLFEPQFFWPLIALALFSLLPLFYKRWAKKQRHN